MQRPVQILGIVGIPDRSPSQQAKLEGIDTKFKRRHETMQASIRRLSLAPKLEDLIYDLVRRPGTTDGKGGK